MTDSLSAISLGAFRATPTGLQLPKGKVPIERWLEYGAQLRTVQKALRWCIGDWLNYGERRYGEMYSQGLVMWPEYSYGELRKMVHLANRFELFRRRNNVGWSMHMEVASLPPPEQETWLDKFEREEATRGEFREANRKVIATGPLLENDEVLFFYWALPRPLTSGWGSGAVWQRMVAEGLGTPGAAFGVRDNIPAGVFGVDLTTGHDWNDLPFEDNQFEFGYWDPPYDHLYKNEGIEIWRTCQRIAILHTHIWPRAWLKGAKRQAMAAITMGPMKQMRCLQVFEKAEANISPTTTSQ